MKYAVLNRVTFWLKLMLRSNITRASVIFLSEVLTITSFSSCNREYHTATMNIIVDFSPRTCTGLWIAHGAQTETFWSKADNDPLKWTDTIKASKFFLSVMTGNKELKSISPFGKYYPFLFFYETGELANGNHIYTLEDEIKLDYEAHYFANSLPDKNGELSTGYELISYRTDGITKFKISTIDKPLFGKAVGESLNEFFKVVFPYQTFIASYKTKSLLYGLMNDDYPTTIDDWLRLNPLAQPTMYFPFKIYPDDIPVTTRFRIEMETDNGTQLCDTSRMITITK